MFSSFTETYIFRFAAAEVFTVLATSYVYVVVRRCRPGWSRFLLALPVFALNCCVPNLFHNWKETVSKTVFCLSHVWLANFKLAALCLNRGSLIRNWTPVQFFAIFAGPITPRDEVIDASSSNMKRVGSKGTLGDTGGSATELTIRFFAKTALLVACVYVLSEKAESIPRLPLELLYAFSLYAFLGFVMDGPASLLTSLIGLEIAPHFNQPYYSDSIAGFWGKRWNLTVSNCLRAPVFDPIIEGQLIHSAGKPHPEPSTMRRFLAMSACFTVSGMMHELIFWYLMGHHTRHWGWLIFFSMQAPIIAAETAIRQQLKRHHIQLPLLVRMPLTIGILLAIADNFFFPPVFLSGLADHVVELMQQNIDGVLSLTGWTADIAL